MKNLAPDIFRQRLVIEGIYNIEFSPEDLKKFLTGLSVKLKMTIVYGPLVKNLAFEVNPAHAGFECFLIWAESGAQLYTWNRNNFFTLDIYTCKSFIEQDAVFFVKDFFKCKDDEIVQRSV